jgi:hypothetical protein
MAERPQQVANLLGRLILRGRVESDEAFALVRYVESLEAAVAAKQNAPAGPSDEEPMIDGWPLYSGLPTAEDRAAYAQPPHADDIAIDRFAAIVKAKVAADRAKGRTGWNVEAECDVEDLASALIIYLSKGDPVEIGTLAMQLQQRGASPAVLSQAWTEFIESVETGAKREAGMQVALGTVPAWFLAICRDELTRRSLVSHPRKYSFGSERGMSFEQVEEWMRQTGKSFEHAVNLLASQSKDPVAWLVGDAHACWIEHAAPKIGVADGEGLVTEWAEPIGGSRSLDFLRAALAAARRARGVRAAKQARSA